MSAFRPARNAALPSRTTFNVRLNTRFGANPSLSVLMTRLTSVCRVLTLCLTALGSPFVLVLNLWPTISLRVVSFGSHLRYLVRDLVRNGMV